MQCSKRHSAGATPKCNGIAAIKSKGFLSVVIVNRRDFEIKSTSLLHVMEKKLCLTTQKLTEMSLKLCDHVKALQDHGVQMNDSNGDNVLLGCNEVNLSTRAWQS